MEKTPHILVVDDNREIRNLLARYLTKNGMRVGVAGGGPEMRQQMRGGVFDLVVLDIMMPGEDGLTLCRQLRQTSNVPIVLLTAVSEETDRIVGLELGADDYVTKPFNPRELLARIRAVLRRTGETEDKGHESSARTYKFSGWLLETARRRLLDPGGIEVAI